jgi:hypothetical protein
MTEDIFHGDVGYLSRCNLGALDQLLGLRWGQFRGSMVDKAGDGVAGWQQLDTAAEQYLEFAGNTGNGH